MLKQFFNKSSLKNNMSDALDETLVLRKRIEKKLKYYQPTSEKATFVGPDTHHFNIDPEGMIEFC